MMSAKLRWILTGAVLGAAGTLLLGRLPAPSHAAAAPAPVPNDGKLRILVFGAHPDDAELRAGGVAAKWAALGHHVKFVSVINGDIGHW
ncbi:MAG TPA: PIG-L family deacetylase, partial [Armatimonadota bacterium]|nr:PIG-L family deacetylase [Armatimonadota bacterium]